MQQNQGTTISVRSGAGNYKARKGVRRLWQNLAKTNLAIQALPPEGREESQAFGKLAARRNQIAKSLDIKPAKAAAYMGEPAKKKKRSKKN